MELIWKTTKFLSDKAAEKSRFREISTDEKKKAENAIPATKKKPQTLVSNDKVSNDKVK